MTDMHAIAHRILTHDYPDMRERVRTACATLRDAVGSDGPESIESFAERAAARIAELEKAVSYALSDLREHVGDGECAGPHGNAREGACSRCRPAEYLADALKVRT